MNKKMIMIAAGAVLLLGGAGAGYYFMFADSPDSETAEAAETAAAPEATIAVLDLDPFLTNMERHARVQVKLAVAPAESLPLIQADALLIARMRDQILTLLTAKSYEELEAPGGKDAFRREIFAALKPFMKDAELKEVLFSDFVIQ